MLNFFSIARPSCPSFQTEMKQNLTCGVSFTILVQPPLLSSPWQFEHHGAQRCTTLISGDLIASKTFCSAGDSARTDMAARMAMNSGVRGIDMFYRTIKGKGPTLNAERCQLTECTKTPSMASRFRDSSYAEIFPERFRGIPKIFGKGGFLFYDSN